MKKKKKQNDRQRAMFSRNDVGKLYFTPTRFNNVSQIVAVWPSLIVRETPYSMAVATYFRKDMVSSGSI